MLKMAKSRDVMVLQEVTFDENITTTNYLLHFFVKTLTKISQQQTISSTSLSKPGHSAKGFHP